MRCWIFYSELPKDKNTQSPLDCNSTCTGKNQETHILLLQSTYNMKALRRGTRLPSPSHSLVFNTFAFCEQFTAQRRRSASLQLTTSTLPLCPMHCCRHPTSLAFKAHQLHSAQGHVVAQRTERAAPCLYVRTSNTAVPAVPNLSRAVPAIHTRLRAARPQAACVDHAVDALCQKCCLSKNCPP